MGTNYYLLFIKSSNKSRVAVITGGARRLGRQITYFLARSNYSVAVIYNSSDKKEVTLTQKYLNSLGTEYEFYRCDLRNLVKTKELVRKIGKRFRKIDILINNAGVINKTDFLKITPELFENTISVNLKAPLFMSQFCYKYLLKSDEPQIINIASIGGLMNWSGFIPYSISKAGLIKLTYLLARRLAPHIRVNAIAPGTIVIRGEERLSPSKIKPEKIPLNRYGEAEDIIEALKFIIDCKYLTGQVISVDGGRSINI
ncbi:MAG: SDR family oxidoreductase [Ignavibacteria bacterium]|nr:SDR family oxidoreductase [Ignavibacteria bacterium]